MMHGQKNIKKYVCLFLTTQCLPAGRADALEFISVNI